MDATATAAKRQSARPVMTGVLYAEDFDDDVAPATDNPAEPAPEPEFIEPTFSADELEQARTEARAAGWAEAERGMVASRLQMLSTIAAEITTTRAAAQAHAEELAEAMASCLLSALKVCLPSLCSRHGAPELRALSRHVLPLLTDEPRITIRVHPHMIPVMQEEVSTLDFEISERIQLVPTEAMAPGDMRINWKDGAAIRDTKRAIVAIEDALAQLGLLPSSTLQPEMTDA